MSRGSAGSSGVDGVSPWPAVTITYCTQCRWLLRASWLAQELLTTFSAEITELTLRPGTGGVLRIEVGDDVIFDRVRDGGFPDLERASSAPSATGSPPIASSATSTAPPRPDAPGVGNDPGPAFPRGREKRPAVQSAKA